MNNNGNILKFNSINWENVTECEIFSANYIIEKSGACSYIYCSKCFLHNNRIIEKSCSYFSSINVNTPECKCDTKVNNAKIFLEYCKVLNLK